ncbi:MAG: GspH/FimT family pseudopilin [Thiotrichales bacterium]|nr:GspH/FimT family pseudopilin [Thiotrichales bacterium]
MNRQSGLSLLETMATLAILGILASVALPSFGELLKNNRISNQANTIISSLHYARGEAITRAVSVQVEPLVTGTDWTLGWRVRIDGNNNNSFGDTADVVIKNYTGVDGSTLNTAVGTLVFNSAGSATAANTLTLRANDCTAEHQRIINVGASGIITLNNNKNC